MSGITIGRLAEAAGVNVETIRFYQQVGLIRSPARPPRGVRRYAEGDVARLGFIRRAQGLGFALAEIRQLLALEDRRSCTAARALAEQKLQLVKTKLADLARMRDALTDLVARCDRRRGQVTCPIIATLSGEKYVKTLPQGGA